jgi:hypothetical protein
LKCPKPQRWEEEPLTKWPNMNEEKALRKLLTGKKTTELRNVSILAQQD